MTSARTGTTRLRVAALALATALAVLSQVGGATAETTSAVQVPLTSFFNNVGIAANPTSGANFDGGGFAYSGLLLERGDPINGIPGLTAGQTVTTGGFTFTWPNRVGTTDNVEAVGQTIPIPAAPGATRFGVLASSVQGASSGVFTFTYTGTDERGDTFTRTVTRQLAFTDWTRGLLGDAPLEAGNTVVAKALARHTPVGGIPYPTQPHVFLVSTTLGAPPVPGMVLTSVKLPLNLQIHLFAMALA